MLPLVLLCLDLFAWNFASLAYEVSGNRAYHTLDVSLSPLTAALGLHVIVGFVGRVRELRWVLAANYALFIGLVVLPNRRIELLMPLALLPMTIVAVGLLAVHLRRNVDRTERARTWALVVAFVIGAVTGPVEYFERSVVFPIGGVGLLVTTSLVGWITVRFRLLGRAPGASAVGTAVLVAAACALGCIGAYRVLGGGTGVVLVGSSVVVVAMFFALRELMFGYADERARQRQLATLGRFSSQLAHDLKNPLASMKGALQFLSREKPLAEYGEFLGIMLEQVDRMHRVIDDYQRIGRVEPIRAAVDVNELLQRVVALQSFGQAGLEVKTELAGDLPRVSVDPDLLSTALDNLLRNACEAMPDGGTLGIATERGDHGVIVRVSDTGVGMDPRQQASAFDEFFTTKASGSGLGLSFVRRVIEAHQGTVSLDSTLGRGTTVSVELPLA